MTKNNNFERLNAKECALRILDIKKPLVLIHVRPDGDAVGSAAALSEIFRQLGERPVILSADKIPDRLNFILEKTGACIAENTDGYTAVSIDVASPAQLGELAETAPSPVLMIDHHAVGEQFADGYIVPEASSAAEALYEVALALESMGKIRINKSMAYALYTAISSDTGCFAYSNAKPKTHLVAARLMEIGIDTADINNKLFHSKSKEQISAEGFIASKINTANNGKTAYATLTRAERESLGLSTEHFETAIDIVRSLAGVEIAFVVKENDEGKFKVSLRSCGADVAAVAKKFDGGGHIRAAGCSVEASDSNDAVKQILNAINERISL